MTTRQKLRSRKRKVTRNSSRDENTRTWRTSSYLFTYARLSIDIHWTGSSPIRHEVLVKLKTFELELDFASIGLYSTLMCGLRIFARPPIYHLQYHICHCWLCLYYIMVYNNNCQSCLWLQTRLAVMVSKIVKRVVSYTHIIFYKDMFEMSASRACQVSGQTDTTQQKRVGRSKSRYSLNMRFETWRQLLRVCVRAGGRHFEHIMIWLATRLTILRQWLQVMFVTTSIVRVTIRSLSLSTNVATAML